jgi:DNA-binding transcriptional regulator LsrR (DeoR family)
VEDLEEAGCVGDMLWQPIGVSGPIEMRTGVRAMTIMDLSDVKEFFKSGKQVLVVAGPCSVCHTPKTEVVKAILEQKDHLITHLVVDSRCGRELLSAQPNRPTRPGTSSCEQPIFHVPR